MTPSDAELLQTLLNTSEGRRALLETAEGRQYLAEQSPQFFDTNYCGMRYARHRTSWLERMEEEFHAARESNLKRKILFLAPRDHGKTETGVSFATRRICLNRDIRILWVSEALEPAKKRLKRVKNLLKSDAIQRDFCSGSPSSRFRPLIQADGDKWTDTQIYVSRDTMAVDPTMEAVGAGGAVTGGHFDLIIVDDLKTDKTVHTRLLRDRTREWIRGTLEPMLVRGGLMVVIGTKKHAADAYGGMRENPTFSVIEDPAILQWPEDIKWSYVTDDKGQQRLDKLTVTGDYKVLWPEERPLEHLLRERESIGPTMFAREFQHKVVDDSTAAFKMEDLQRAMERGAGYCLYKPPPGVRLDIVQGWDLALVADPLSAERKDSDFTVGITLARDMDNGDRYLLGIRRERGLSQTQLEQVIQAEYTRFMELGLPPRTVAIEKNNFGAMVIAGLMQSASLPLAPHQTTSNKSDAWSGVPSISLLFEQTKVVLPTGDLRSKNAVEELVLELHGLGKEKHDDMVMAFWIAECVLRPVSGGSEPLRRIVPGIRTPETPQKDPGDKPHPLAMRVLTNRGWEWKLPSPDLYRR